MNYLVKLMFVDNAKSTKETLIEQNKQLRQLNATLHSLIESRQSSDKRKQYKSTLEGSSLHD